jgi:hypothetical protein
MNARDLGNFEFCHMVQVAVHQPAETIFDAEDSSALAPRQDSCGTDDAVDPRGRAATNQYADVVH